MLFTILRKSGNFGIESWKGKPRPLRSALIFSLLLLALAAAGAREAVALDNVVDRWVASGETIVVNDQSFTLYLSARTNEIVADYGAGSLFVSNNSCDSTLSARICLDNIQYDFTAKINKMKIRGISLAPSLSITREGSKSKFLVTDQTIFTVTIKNSGGLARNMTYQEMFPQEFRVTDSDGIPLLADRAVWKGKLDEGGSVSFSYTVKSLAPFDGTLVSSLTYNAGLQHKTIYSSKLALKTTPPFLFTASLGDETILAGERDNLTINLTNKLPETAIVKLEVFFDPGLKIISWPYSVKNTSLSDYAWSGEIIKGNVSVNTSQAMFFEFKGAKVGNSGIIARASYRGKGEADMKALPQQVKHVTVSNKGVIVRTSLKDATLESNQGKRLKIWLQNLNPYVSLRGVAANISTGLVYLPDAFLDSMAPLEQKLLVDKFFFAPNLSGTTGYVLETNVSYLTEFGDNFSKIFRDTATVLPSQGVVLDQVVSRTGLKAGEEAVVTVTVRNQRLTRINNVYVTDNVSSEFQVIGKNFAMIAAGSKENVNAYTYKIKVPHIGMGTVLYVNTTLTYSDAYNSDSYFEPGQYVITKVTQVSVEPEPIPLTISRVIDDSSGIYAGEQFYVKYAITNTANDRVAKNIVLKLPVTYEFDIIDSADVEIPTLDPGESIAVSSSDKRRAKLVGNVVLKRAVLEYENIFGDKYAINSSDTSLTVKEKSFSGPVILLEKLAPKSVNNTDDFTVQLKVKNTGTAGADVAIDDEGKHFVVSVQNGTEYSLNTTARHSIPGNIQLPQALATYSYKGSVFKTASKDILIDVVNNPVFGIEKIVPASVNNVESYSVALLLKNKVRKQVENITIKDGDNQWHIAALGPQSNTSVSYVAITKTIGRNILSPASVTYIYEGALYAVASESPVINVVEKKFVSLAKEVTPANAAVGAKVTVVLTLKSLYDEPVQAILLDAGNTFTEDIGPDEEKNVSYEGRAGNSTGDAASATYTVNSQQYTVFSDAPRFSLAALEESKPAAAENMSVQQGNEEKQQKEGGIFDTIVRFLVKILTWKRGGLE